MQHLVVVRGDAPPATAAMATSLGGDLLVWDEADHFERWRDRPDTFEVRTLPIAERARQRFGPGAEQRVRQLAVRAYLARRRSAAVIAVGEGALGIASWLGHHRGRRCWVPTTDDLPSIARGLTVPAADAGGPQVVAVVDDLVVAHGPLAPHVDDRWRWLPGWAPGVPCRSPTTAAHGALAFGPADREHGLDLLGRTLAEVRAHAPAPAPEAGVRVTWLVPAGTNAADDEVADLCRAHVERSVTFVEDDDPADHPLVDEVGAVLLVGREPNGPDDELLLARAYRAGARFVATDRWAAPAPGLGGAWSSTSFGDARATAAALLAALASSAGDGPPGPFGALGLFEGPR